jgi:condensin-2 complex subunit H2
LADNWNIDIAAELEEYLDDLEGITISIDGISKKLNFAEGLFALKLD